MDTRFFLIQYSFNFICGIQGDLENTFSVACTQLYKPLCWSVGVLVSWSVGLLVRQSVCRWLLGACNLWQSALFWQKPSINFVSDLRKIVRNHLDWRDWTMTFLVACTQLYKPLIWSIHQLVSWSIGPSVGRICEEHATFGDWPCFFLISSLDLHASLCCRCH